jgi:predicted DNA-binding transcriptional regulator YafY
MSIIRYFKKIQYIDGLIRKKATGNQEQFARKTQMSKSMLKEYLREMKELGFPINFCRHRKTYYYKEEGKMVNSLFTKENDTVDMKQFRGGSRQSLINVLQPEPIILP